MEIVEIFDINKNKVNKAIPRGSEIQEDGEFYLYCDLWIINKNNDILLISKKIPNDPSVLYEPITSYVLEGQDEISSLINVTKDMLKFDISSGHFNDLNLIIDHKTIRQSYFIKKDFTLDSLKYDKEKLDAIIVTIEEFNEMYNNNKIIKLYEQFSYLYFDCI